jgi:hypothetical protein
MNNTHFEFTEVVPESGSTCRGWREPARRTLNVIPVLKFSIGGEFLMTSNNSVVHAAAVHVAAKSIVVNGTITTTAMGYATGPGTDTGGKKLDVDRMAGSYGGMGGGAWEINPNDPRKGICNSKTNTNFTYCLGTQAMSEGRCDSKGGADGAGQPGVDGCRYSAGSPGMWAHVDCDVFGFGSGGASNNGDPNASSGGGFINLTTTLDPTSKVWLASEGSLLANGEASGALRVPGNSDIVWGGGSGGTVMIKSQTVSLASVNADKSLKSTPGAKITANGGNATNALAHRVGAGGGGRILIDCQRLEGTSSCCPEKGKACDLAFSVDIFSACFQQDGFKHIQAAGGSMDADPGLVLEKKCCQKGGAGTIAVSAAAGLVVHGKKSDPLQFLVISGGAAENDKQIPCVVDDDSPNSVNAFAFTPLNQSTVASANLSHWNADLVLIGADSVTVSGKPGPLISPPVIAKVLNFTSGTSNRANLQLHRRPLDSSVGPYTNSTVRVVTGSVLFSEGELVLSADEITVAGGQLGLGQDILSPAYNPVLNISSLNCTFKGTPKSDNLLGSVAKLVGTTAHVAAEEAIRAQDGAFAVSTLLTLEAGRICVFGMQFGVTVPAADTFPATAVRLTKIGATTKAAESVDWSACQSTSMYAHLELPTVVTRTDETVPRVDFQIFSNADAEVAVKDAQAWTRQLFVSARGDVKVSNWAQSDGDKKLDSQAENGNVVRDWNNASAFCNRTISAAPPVNFNEFNSSWTGALLGARMKWNGVWVTSGGSITVPEQTNLTASLVMLCAHKAAIVAGSVNTSFQGFRANSKCEGCGACMHNVVGLGAAHGGHGGYITAVNRSGMASHSKWWNCTEKGNTCVPKRTACGALGRCLWGGSGGCSGTTGGLMGDDDASVGVSARGGGGGGVVFIDAPLLTMGSQSTGAAAQCASSLLADGGGGSGGGGGGAGGTIWLHDVANLTVSKPCLGNPPRPAPDEPAAMAFSFLAGVAPSSAPQTVSNFALFSAHGGDGSGSALPGSIHVDGGAGSGGVLNWTLSTLGAEVTIWQLGTDTNAVINATVLSVSAGTSAGANSSAADGLESNNACPKGTGYVTCTPCGVGQVSTLQLIGDGGRVCSYCPSGQFSSKISTATVAPSSCTACPKGTFCKANNRFEQCSGSTDQHGVRHAGCEGCPGGRYGDAELLNSSGVSPGLYDKSCKKCTLSKTGGYAQPDEDDDGTIGLSANSQCSFECPPGMVFSYGRCRNPIRAIVDSLGGLLPFCVIVVCGLTLLFVLWSKFVQEHLDRYTAERKFKKRSKRHQNTLDTHLDSALLSPAPQKEHSRGLHDHDLKRHICRMYFSGHNKAKAPWILSPKLAQNLESVIKATEFADFAAECNKLARWDAPDTWQARLRYTISFFCWPISAPLQRLMRIVRLCALQRYVKNYEHDFMKSVRSRTHEDSIKFGCSPDMTLAYLDILTPAVVDDAAATSRPRHMSWAEGASDRPDEDLLPIMLPCSGDGSLDSPFILDCNDILLKAVPSRLNMMIDDAWVIVIGELNDLLRVISPKDIRSTAQPALDYISQINRDSSIGAQLHAFGGNGQVPERSLGSLRLHLAHHAEDQTSSGPSQLPRQLPHGAKLGLMITLDGKNEPVIPNNLLAPTVWFLGEKGRWKSHPRAEPQAQQQLLRSPSSMGRGAFGTIPGSGISSNQSQRIRQVSKLSAEVPTPQSHGRKKSMREEMLGPSATPKHSTPQPRPLAHSVSFSPARARAASEADDPSAMGTPAPPDGYLDSRAGVRNGRLAINTASTPMRASPVAGELDPDRRNFRTGSFEYDNSPDPMAVRRWDSNYSNNAKSSAPPKVPFYSHLISYTGMNQGRQEPDLKHAWAVFFRSHFILPRNTMFGRLWFNGSWHALPRLWMRTIEKPLVLQSLLLSLIVIDFVCHLLVLVQFYCVPTSSSQADAKNSCLSWRSKVRFRHAAAEVRAIFELAALLCVANPARLGRTFHLLRRRFTPCYSSTLERGSSRLSWVSCSWSAIFRSGAW